MQTSAKTKVVHLHSPIYRVGAIPSPEMVNVLEEKSGTKDVFPSDPVRSKVGTDLQTFLFVKAWVRNVAYVKNVWIDVHVFGTELRFGSEDALIHAETLPLHYSAPAEGGGDFFVFDGKIYQGSIATPGSASPKPRAEKIQYRIYYEVNKQVFTDGFFLHQHELASVTTW